MGIIVGVAFIHMLIPGDQLLISVNSPHFFREEHPHFCGALVIIGVTFAHLIQILTSHILNSNFIKKKNKNEKPGSDSEKTLNIANVSIKDITETRPENLTSVSASDICYLEVKELNDEVDIREKQIVFYLVELSVAIHSILIGFAFGLSSVNKIIPLTFALLFHQFFEGMAISSIFLEAKFTRIKPYLVMIGIYTLTLPLGAFIGIVVIASGILIYDSLVNILASHTNSKIWTSLSIGKKATQMFCFYLGLFIISLINTMI